MREIKCDQFSVTLDVDKGYISTMNELYFQKYASAIADALQLDKVFNYRDTKSTGLNGYNRSIIYGDKAEIAMLYHDDLEQGAIMRFYIAFTSSGFDNYKLIYEKLNGTEIEIYDILRMMDTAAKKYHDELDLSSDYTRDAQEQQKFNHKITNARISRIDIAIDYIDEDFSIPEFYSKLTTGDYIILNKARRKVKESSINAHMNSHQINTIEVHKRSSSSFLRIYNKIEEQIAKKGRELKKAAQAKEWTRIELELKEDYAHQLSDKIINLYTKDSFIDLMIHAFIECFEFLEIVDYNGTEEVYEHLPFYSDLVRHLNNDKPLFKSADKTQHSELERKYNSFFSNGSLALFRMIYEIDGLDGFDAFCEMIKSDMMKINLNNKHEKMILTHMNTERFYEKFMP